MKRLNILSSALAMLAALEFCGCSHEEPPPTKAAAKPAPADGIQNLAAHVNRGKERQKVQNDFRELALLYQTYVGEIGRAPKDWKEFEPYIRKDSPPSLLKGIAENQYVVTWNARLAANIVLAYEKEPDLNGNRLVVMGDASIHLLEPAEFKKAMENKG
jgi:hypothetical protein